ncbi:MAG: cobalt ECF transporter T component CbiQ [Lachnospiraceae bacterium]|nr:cobalt ECF transporter T component CbiQ [Lachnospiraceae bacterium]
MTKLEQAVNAIHVADNAGDRHTGASGIHPLSRLLVTIFYVFSVLSFPKYNMTGLAGMVLYILIQCIWYEISIRDMLKRIWPVLLLTGLIGITNPLFDRTVSDGMVSMATLILKGMFCVMASYILGIHTGVRQFCYALRLLHLPKEIVTVFLLMHRYLIVLLKELERMQQAYKLRAPGQRGLHFKTWGSFVGLLLLRSIDRAGEVYESMQLRGFNGAMGVQTGTDSRVLSIIYVVAWGTAILTIRLLPVFEMAGGIF